MYGSAPMANVENPKLEPKKTAPFIKLRVAKLDENRLHVKVSFKLPLSPPSVCTKPQNKVHFGTSLYREVVLFQRSKKCISTMGE